MSQENDLQKEAAPVHFSPSPSNSDSCGLVSFRMMCIEVPKLTVKVRPIAAVRRAVSFKLFKDP